MSWRYLSISFKKFFLFAILFAIPTLSSAQELIPASPPIADPKDTRFVGVKEDWTNPSISTSNLRPALPLIGSVSEYPGYTVELDDVQWRWGDPLDLYIVKPKGVKKPPVIVYLYGYPTDTDTFKNEAWQTAVTKNGFAAVGFVTALTGHRYHDRPMKEWFVSDLQECLAVSAHDVQMVLNYLAERGDVDMDRVGIMAEGSGASVAILASAVDSRIKVLDAVDPWGDWPTWMATSPFVPKDERENYVKPEYLKKTALLDPVDWLPKVQAKKLRLQDAVFDTDTPKASQEKLRAAVPAGGTVVIYKTLREYREALNGNKVMEWMEGELRGLPDAAAPSTASLQK
jgi:cephalosporin-C deacetylase-like acetyl esterase